MPPHRTADLIDRDPGDTTPVRAPSPIARASLHDQVVARLADMITEGVLEPGQKIPERQLCASLGISRTPLREALKVLARDALVVLMPNQGARVSKITIADVDEVFPVMGALEALAGELAAERITDAQLARIARLHERMVRHYEAGRRADYFRLNQAIHETILEAADNPTLSATYVALARRIRRLRYLANMSPARWAQAVREHVEILHALEVRDGASLAAILKRHLHNKLETVKATLKAESGPR